MDVVVTLSSVLVKNVQGDESREMLETGHGYGHGDMGHGYGYGECTRLRSTHSC